MTPEEFLYSSLLVQVVSYYFTGYATYFPSSIPAFVPFIIFEYRLSCSGQLE